MRAKTCLLFYDYDDAIIELFLLLGDDDDKNKICFLQRTKREKNGIESRNAQIKITANQTNRFDF